MHYSDFISFSLQPLLVAALARILGVSEQGLQDPAQVRAVPKGTISLDSLMERFPDRFVRGTQHCVGFYYIDNGDKVAGPGDLALMVPMGRLFPAMTGGVNSPEFEWWSFEMGPTLVGGNLMSQDFARLVSAMRGRPFWGIDVLLQHFPFCHGEL